MGKETALDSLRFSAAGDAGKAVIDFLKHLKYARRSSAHTTAAYGRDLMQFCDFLTMHLGSPPGLHELEALSAADFRSFLAHRRATGVESRTLARQLSAIRSLFRFLDRNGVLRNSALAALKGPKLPHGVPRPLSVDAARRLCADRAPGTARSPWIEARDQAVLVLLYACGLRISEALNLNRRDAPLDHDVLSITGKGNKVRLVPVLPMAREAVRRYLEVCPESSGAQRSAVRRRQGPPAECAQCSAAHRAVARRARAAGQRDPPCTAPQLRHSPPGRRRRSQVDSGVARPRLAVDNPGLHRDRPSPPRQAVFQGAPAGLKYFAKVPIPDPVSSDPELPSRAEVVVIGGGIIGAATALELAERRVDVALCEKGEIAAEQSSRNWGWCRQMNRDPREIPLIVESLRLWRAMNARVEAETGFRECGILYLAETAAELETKLKWYEENARPYGLSSRPVSGAEAETLQPGAAIKWAGGLYTPDDGRAEPTKAAPAIAEAARRKGARIFTRCAVRGIETSGGRVSGVVTERGRIDCAAVVLAGGAWSRLFLGNLGIPFPQAMVVNSVMRSAPLEAGVERSCSAGKFAFRRRLDGGYTIAHRHLSVADIVPETFSQFFRFLPVFVLDHRGLRLRLGKAFLEFDPAQAPLAAR